MSLLNYANLTLKLGKVGENGGAESRKPGMLAMPTPEVMLEVAQCERDLSKKYIEIQALPDTGAAATVINKETARRLGLEVRPTSLKLVAANDTAIQVHGQVEIFVKVSGYKGEVTAMDAIVADNPNDKLLLLWHHMLAMGLLYPSWPIPHMSK